MIKILTSLLLLVVLTPSVEAGVRRGGQPKCRRQGKVVVCRMPKVNRPNKCGVMPCIPRGYFRPNPPRIVPMR